MTAEPSYPQPTLATLSVGDVIGHRELKVDRLTLIKYAGASGDFNPIHWNENFATSVGLPGVIAHGMWTMGSVVNLVTDWVKDPGAIIDYQTRFTKPVEVPKTGFAELFVEGKIGAIDTENRTVRVDLTATFADQKVLAKTQVQVRLS